MDGPHPNQYDKRPKRRRDKDNPYELFTVGIETPEPLYFIRFKDGEGNEHTLRSAKTCSRPLTSLNWTTFPICTRLTVTTSKAPYLRRL